MSGAQTAPSVQRRLLFFAVAFTLAALWPALAAAQSLECPPELTCPDADLDETVGDLEGTVEETVGTVEETVGGTGETLGSVVAQPNGVVEDIFGGLLDEGVGEVEGTVGGVEEAVEETVGGVGGTVQETVEGVQETAGGVQGTAEKAVEEVTQGATGTASTVGQSADGLLGSGVQSSGDSFSGSSGGLSQLGSAGSGTRTEGMLTRELARGLGVPAIFLTDGTVDVSEIFTQPTSGGAAAETGSSGGVAGVLGEIAKKIAFPLALALVLGGFLLVQNRLDRSDPKLASAPRDTNLLHFE